MVTITINVKESVAEQFRKRAHQLYGKKKGTLGRAISEAMQEWVRKRLHFEKCMTLLEEGADMGKIKYSSRDELYDRN